MSRITGTKGFAVLGLAVMMLMAPLTAKAEPPLNVNTSTCGEFVDYLQAALADDKATGNDKNMMKSKTYELAQWSAENVSKINGKSRQDEMDTMMGIFAMCSQDGDASIQKAIKMLR